MSPLDTFSRLPVFGVSGYRKGWTFTWGKNLVGGAGSGYQYYDWRLTKALATTDQKLQFVNQLNYDLPFGRGRRFVNRGGVLNYLIGGWTFLTIQSIRSGLPVSFSSRQVARHDG